MLVYAVAVALAVAVGTGRPAWATPIEGLINPVLAALLYVTFLEIPFVRLREAFTNGRFIGAALGLNFLVVPVVVWGLTRNPAARSGRPRRRPDGVVDAVYRLRHHVH